MKNILIAALILSSTPVWAGAMGELWSTTNLSVRETLGYEAKIVSIEQKFAPVPGFELAVKSTVYGYNQANEVVPTFECISGYRESNAGSYQLIGTDCQAL
ncbi:MAG: hypothetical protein ACKOX6_02025 [Bdellovibrio sp.]